MNILKCGCDVTIRQENLAGTITGCIIRFERVAYEVSYFYNGEYTSVWLDECQFDSEGAKKTKIGFR